MSRQTNLNTPANDPIALMVKRLRRERGWSQRELARRAEIGVSTLSRIERGGRNVTVNSMLQVASALGAEFTLTLAMPGDRAHMTVRSQRLNVMTPASEQPKD